MGLFFPSVSSRSVRTVNANLPHFLNPSMVKEKELRLGYYSQNTSTLRYRILAQFQEVKDAQRRKVECENKCWAPMPVAMYFKLNSLWGALKNARKFSKELNNISK